MHFGLSAQGGKEYALPMEWVPPSIGEVKIKFDGASFGNLGPVCFGCLMWGHHGSIIIAKGGPIGRTDANLVELIGLLVCGCLRIRVLKSALWKEIPGLLSAGGREEWVLEAAALHL